MQSELKLLFRFVKKKIQFISIYQIFYKRHLKQQVSMAINKLYKEEIYVLNGPFRGMKYLSTSNGSQLLPKLIGSYEEPIHNWIFNIINNPIYSVIVDVGCAEGYYAVGFARSQHRPQIFAFDIDNSALVNAKKLSVINGLSESIKFYNKFEFKALKNILNDNPNQKVLIFMDIEGDERNFLDTTKYPLIKECDILVELHDCFYPGLTQKINSFFSQTHNIEIVKDYPWREGVYSFNSKDFSSEETLFLFNENRPNGMSWMLAKKK